MHMSSFLSKWALFSQLTFNIQTPSAHQSFTFKFNKDASLISGDYDVLEVKTLSAATNNLLRDSAFDRSISNEHHWTEVTQQALLVILGDLQTLPQILQKLRLSSLEFLYNLLY